MSKSEVKYALIAIILAAPATIGILSLGFIALGAK